MAMTREELEKKGLAAKSAEEIFALLKAEGQEVTQDLAEELYKKAKAYQEEAQKLSLDELDAVVGGRDYLADGCAATVEPDSDCWNKDGGCLACYYSYNNGPIHSKCKWCRRWLVSRTYGYKHPEGNYYRCVCRVCGTYDVSYAEGKDM